MRILLCEAHFKKFDPGLHKPRTDAPDTVLRVPGRKTDFTDSLIKIGVFRKLTRITHFLNTILSLVSIGNSD